jgi:uncharacterized protein (DUF2236 family)
VEGLFGPDSYTWRLLREVAVLAGGGRALALQLAHPAVAAGVNQHSDFRRDPAGRARRTFSSMYQIVFGDLESALKMARRIFAIHRKVAGVAEAESAAPAAGRPYRADDPALLKWVLATLYDSALLAYERLIRPISHAERRGLYEETKTMAAVMGIPPAEMPPDSEGFEAYIRGELAGPVLTLGPTAREMCRYLFSSNWLERHVDSRVTASLLPPRIREEIGLPFGPKERFLAARFLGAMKTTFKRLPSALRYTPSYHQAQLRLARARGAAAPRDAEVIALLSRVVALPFSMPA